MELVEVVGRYVPLTRNGKETHGLCPFHDDTAPGNFRVGDTWRCLACGEQDRYEVADDAAFLQAFLGCDRSQALYELENDNGLPPLQPIQQAKLRRPPFTGLSQVHKRLDDRIWIHDKYEAVDAARILVPERVHCGLIPGRSWEDLGLPPKRTCILLPTNTETARARMERLADRLLDDGHTVRLIDPSDRPEYWTLVDAAQQMTHDELMGWAQSRMSARPLPNDAAQQASGECGSDRPAAVQLGNEEERPKAGSTPASPAAAASPTAAPLPELPALRANPSALSSGHSLGAQAQQPAGGAATLSTKARKASPAQPEQPKHKGNGAFGAPLSPQERVAAQREADTAAVLSGIVFTCIADVQPEAVRWLWPGRIPLGELTMIVGDPGLGKSQICASLASVVTNGGQWPVDRSRSEVGSVLILSAEDNIKHTIRPRLDAAGADVTRCHTLQAIKRNNESGMPYESGFSLAEDLAKLSILMDHLGDVRLVIIDPVSAYLGETDSHKNAEVRGMLAPLTTLAGNHHAAIILVSHLTKSQSANALMRVQGSIAFAALCRAVWGVARDKDSAERRLFMPLKNNLGQDKSGLAYAIEPFDLVGDETIPTSRIMWEAQAVEMGAEEAFGANLTHEERTEVDEAKDFLREALSEGRIKSVDVRRAAQAAGHKDTTIGRAKRSLKVKSEREGFAKDAVWYWRMPDAASASDEPRNWQDD